MRFSILTVVGFLLLVLAGAALVVTTVAAVGLFVAFGLLSLWLLCRALVAFGVAALLAVTALWLAQYWRWLLESLKNLK